MNLPRSILVVGSGGREHALVRALALETTTNSRVAGMWLPVVMKGMKITLCMLFMAATHAFAAAPASLAGKVFRNWVADNFTATTDRRAPIEYYENTIFLGADSRYRCLVSSYGTDGGFLDPPGVFVGEPRPDGTYTYARTNDTTATLVLRTSSGSPPRAGLGGFITLVFTSDSGGVVREPGGLFSKVETFSISDAASMHSAPASNISQRARTTATSPLISGLVVPGTAVREVLIRVVGPSLAPLGVSGVWADPDFKIFRGSTPASLSEGILGDWSSGNTAGLRRIFDYVGAFPLLDNSKDAVAVVRLAPGAYTIVCSPPTGDPGGEALIEIYFLP